MPRLQHRMKVNVYFTMPRKFLLGAAADPVAMAKGISNASSKRVLRKSGYLLCSAFVSA